MTGGGNAPGIEGATTASLHTLDVRLAALKRLLGRRDGDGALIPADRPLIAAAIEAARKDLEGVRDLLATVPENAADPYRTTARVMVDAVAELDKLLDVLKGSVPRDG